MKLVWAIQNIAALKRAVASKTAMFGTLDTWLLYKLTGGRTYVTDISSASATGFYDPFVLDWASWPAFTGLSIPFDILPKVVPNDYDSFGHVDKAIFGMEIPIRCSVRRCTRTLTSDYEAMHYTRFLTNQHRCLARVVSNRTT